MGGAGTGPGRSFGPEELTIPTVLDARADERPDQPLLYVAGEPLTYRELQARSLAAAGALGDLGVGAGDRVALMMGTSPEWLVTWFGAARLGAVIVPINTAYRGEFLAHQLRESGSVVMAVDQSLLGRLAEVADGLEDLRTVLVRPDTPAAEGGGAPRRSPATLPIAVLADGDPAPTGATYNAPCAIFYTSGTTGRSKGALATHHYLLTAGQTMVECWDLQPGEVVYAPLPLFHLSAVGSVLGPMLAGGTGVLERSFSVGAFWDQVRRYQAAGVALAGPMLSMLWNQPPDSRDAEVPVRFISAAPVPKDLYPKIQERWGAAISTCYGLSEAFPLVIARVGDDNPPGASGRANPNFEVAIVDAEDRPVAPGVVGEIVCRPTRRHVMMEGYFARPAETVAQLKNLWFHTGDLGSIDAEGHFTYADRKKDALRRRGENISSFEVEQAVLRHPDVLEVAVVGVASELGEDDVFAVLVLAPGTDFEVEAFMGFCSTQLPYFAVPRYVEVVEELPKNAVGRVLKHELRQRGPGPRAWDGQQAGYVVAR